MPSTWQAFHNGMAHVAARMSAMMSTHTNNHPSHRYWQVHCDANSSFAQRRGPKSLTPSNSWTILRILPPKRSSHIRSLWYALQEQYPRAWRVPSCTWTTGYDASNSASVNCAKDICHGDENRVYGRHMNHYCPWKQWRYQCYRRQIWVSFWFNVLDIRMWWLKMGIGIGWSRFKGWVNSVFILNMYVPLPALPFPYIPNNSLFHSVHSSCYQQYTPQQSCLPTPPALYPCTQTQSQENDPTMQHPTTKRTNAFLH